MAAHPASSRVWHANSNTTCGRRRRAAAVGKEGRRPLRALQRCRWDRVTKSRVQQQTRLRLRRERTPERALGALSAPHSHIPGYRVYRRLVRLAARTQSAGDEGPRARGLWSEPLGWRLAWGSIYGWLQVDESGGECSSARRRTPPPWRAIAARAEANRVAAQPRGCSVASRGRVVICASW